jgi:O-antigen/teichoic acid export membrane protein
MKNFIKDFVAKKGIWVGASLIISRVSAFLLSIFAARLLSKDDFGLSTFGLNFIAIFIAFAGFGSAQGVLKYGSTIQNKNKKDFFVYAFSYGLLLNFLLTIIIFILAFILYHHNSLKLWLICILSIRFLGTYLVEQKKAEYRANFDNESFAKLDIFLSVSALVLGLVLIYFYQLNGFLISLSVSPFLLFLYDRKFKFSLQKINFESFTTKSFWHFSWSTALTTQVGELVFILDLFFIGLMMRDQDVAYYKVSSMIPTNILVLGFIFMQTEYPKLCLHHLDKKYQHQFIKNYFKLFAIISFAIIFFGFVFSEELLSIFGSKYKETQIFKILLSASVISLLFRVLFVYMLAAIGKPLWNLYISGFLLISISISLYFVIPVYQLFGVAVVTLVCYIFSGFLPAFAYFYESKKLLK